MNSRLSFGSSIKQGTALRLDAAQREVESWQPAGWKPGEPGGVFRGTLADLARRYDVTPAALRLRLKRCNLPRPTDSVPEATGTPLDAGAGGTPARAPGETEPGTTESGAPGGGAQGEGDQGVTTIRKTDTGIPGQSAYRMVPSIETQTQQANASNLQLSPRAALELSPLSQAEHDAEIAQLCRDSVGAFRRGKSKGPNNRRIIPIAKVGDLQVLDTLFRRATGQTKGDGPSRGNLIQVNVLNRISRETVKPEAEGTSQVIDLNTVASKS